MPPGSVSRVSVDVDVDTPIASAARDEIQGLLDEAQEVDGFAGLSDQAHLGIEEDAPPGVVSFLARAGATGTLVGYSSLSERGGEWSIETVVRPGERGNVPDVHGALLDTALGEVAARGGGAVTAWLRTTLERGGHDMDTRGLRPARELFQLRAPLSTGAVDAGAPRIPVRPFRPGRDESAWLEVNARAFADHPEQGSWRLVDLERREREPWFDPGGFLLHEIGGRLAGFCWTKVHRTPLLGEIYVIGVDPAFQGRGLGRALTLAGLGHLTTRAVPTAMLYVEATNTPALVLYRSLGFTEHHREVQFAGTVSVGAATPGAQADAPTARPIP